MFLWSGPIGPDFFLKRNSRIDRSLTAEAEDLAAWFPGNGITQAG